MIDIVVLILLGLSVAVEVRRGLFLTLFDAARIFVALALGIVGCNVAQKLTGNYLLGIVGFLVPALLVVFVAPELLKRSRLDPAWGRKFGSRVIAGVIGLGLGAIICVAVVPVLARLPVLRSSVADAPLARPFLNLVPEIYTLADRLNVGIPTFGRRAIRFEDEAATGPAFDERIKYSKLDGATCIECGQEIRFVGYQLLQLTAVSPKFVCSNCGRTSDGCQTFEGFHVIYGRCPFDVARDGIALDCGVWPNNRPVVPIGTCPVCGKSLAPRRR